MTGKITAVHLSRYQFRHPGGLIRAAESTSRIKFKAAELIGMDLAEALNSEVDFDILDGQAVRIRHCRQPQRRAS